MEYLVLDWEYHICITEAPQPCRSAAAQSAVHLDFAPFGSGQSSQLSSQKGGFPSKAFFAPTGPRKGRFRMSGTQNSPKYFRVATLRQLNILVAALRCRYHLNWPKRLLASPECNRLFQGSTTLLNF